MSDDILDSSLGTEQPSISAACPTRARPTAGQGGTGEEVPIRLPQGDDALPGAAR